MKTWLLRVLAGVYVLPLLLCLSAYAMAGGGASGCGAPPGVGGCGAKKKDNACAQGQVKNANGDCVPNSDPSVGN